jgi:thioredoxin 1
MTTSSGGNAAVSYRANKLDKGSIMSGNIQEVNETNFKPVVMESDVPVLVNCWTPWCMPCRAQQPILEKLADELQNKVLITSLNIEENRNAAYRLNIHSIPTLVIFNDGEEIRRFFGLQKAESLTKVLEGALVTVSP